MLLNDGANEFFYLSKSLNNLFAPSIPIISAKAGSFYLVIFTSQGNLIYTESISLNAGSNYKSNLMLNNKAKGVFYLRLTNDETVILKKLIIQ